MANQEKEKRREHIRQAESKTRTLERYFTRLSELYRESDEPYLPEVEEEIGSIHQELLQYAKDSIKPKDFYDSAVIQNAVYQLDYILALHFLEKGEFPKGFEIPKFLEAVKGTIKSHCQGVKIKMLDRQCVNEKFLMLIKSKKKRYAEELIRDYASECKWIRDKMEK